MVQTVGVPRQTPRLPGPAELAVLRLSYEREHHGWSHTEVARRLTESGFKISQSSVWSIENDSRRKITLAEAVAFAELYGLRIEELFRPPRDITPQVVREILDDIFEWAGDTHRSILKLLDIQRRIIKLGKDAQALRKISTELDIGAIGVPTAELRSQLANVAALTGELADALPAYVLGIDFEPEQEPGQ